MLHAGQVNDAATLEGLTQVIVWHKVRVCWLLCVLIQQKAQLLQDDLACNT
jgi:hypothetical protein